MVSRNKRLFLKSTSTPSKVSLDWISFSLFLHEIDGIFCVEFLPSLNC